MSPNTYSKLYSYDLPKFLVKLHEALPQERIDAIDEVANKMLPLSDITDAI